MSVLIVLSAAGSWTGKMDVSRKHINTAVKGLHISHICTRLFTGEMSRLCRLSACILAGTAGFWLSRSVRIFLPVSLCVYSVNILSIKMMFVYVSWRMWFCDIWPRWEWDVVGAGGGTPGSIYIMFFLQSELWLRQLRQLWNRDNQNPCPKDHFFKGLHY